jgi:hypothetical protein
MKQELAETLLRKCWWAMGWELVCARNQTIRNGVKPLPRNSERWWYALCFLNDRLTEAAHANVDVQAKAEMKSGCRAAERWEKEREQHEV